MTLKRFICSCGIILIIFMSFITGYAKSSSFVFADSLPSGYTPVTDDKDLAYAFNSYCKSRDLDITSTAAGASITYLYNYIKSYANEFGYNIDAMQEQLFKSVNDPSTPNVVKWYMKTGLIGMYNDIFAKLIRENDLAVGDSVNDKSLYDGYYSNGSFLYYGYNNPFAHEGSYYIYNQYDLYNFGVSNISGYEVRYDLTLPNVNAKYRLRGIVYNGVIEQLYCVENRYLVYSKSNSSIYGFPALYYDTQNSTYYCISVSYPNKTWTTIDVYNSNDVQPCNVYMTTNNTVINNNVYEGDTIINNEGDVTNNDNDTTINYNPYPDGGGTTSTPNNTGGGDGEDDSTITFPDFDFHLPEINWSLGDLSEKFPFSIPFDLIAFFTVLNAEPRAPAIDADIPLGTWYTWHFEADFAQFDNYAVIIRNVEFIGFCVGLIYLTIKLVKG